MQQYHKLTSLLARVIRTQKIFQVGVSHTKCHLAWRQTPLCIGSRIGSRLLRVHSHSFRHISVFGLACVALQNTVFANLAIFFAYKSTVRFFRAVQNENSNILHYCQLLPNRISAFAVPEIICSQKHSSDTDAKLLSVYVKTVQAVIGVSTLITQSVEAFFIRLRLQWFCPLLIRRA